MGTPHKHAKLIKAWADGADIEVYSTHNNCWQDCDPPMWREDTLYRIKPKTIRYRLFLWRHPRSGYVSVETTDTESGVNEAGFIRWLGDWQEVEI